MALKDYEENKIHSDSDSSPGPSSDDFYGETYQASRGSVIGRVWDSFKRDPNAHVTKKGQIGADGKVFDVESAAAATAASPLAKVLKGRHLQMIAIGGSIGALRNPFMHPV